MLIIFDRRVRGGLGALMKLARSQPAPWIAVSVLLMLAQTALSTIPVIAMVPLLQLFASDVSVPESVQLVADLIGTADPRTLIPVFAVCIGIVFLICSVVSVYVTWLQAGRVSRLGAEASAALLSRYTSEPYERHRGRTRADLVRNINVAPQAANTLSSVLTIYTSALTLAGICVVLLVASPLVTIMVIVLFGGIMAFAQRLLRRAQHKAGEGATQATLESWVILLPLIDGFREVRLSGSGSRLLGSYRDSLLKLMRSTRSIATLGSVPAAVSQVVFAFGIAGIALILFTTGSAASAITILGLFAAAAMRALPTINLMFSSIGLVRTAEPNLEILSGIAKDLADTPERVPEAGDRERFRGDIVANGLGFAYFGSSGTVLADVDLVIREHQTTAIVGSSGAGKSTLIDLLLGLLVPTEGEILCGGVRISEDPASWFAGIGVVPQDVFLLNDTLAQNITFGEPLTENNRDRIMEALDFAQLTALVRTLPEGLDTIIGERGTRLSGGQRQRLGLARAMYRMPSVLLLDEATSALDNETEAEITDALRALHGRVTVIVVAHRLSTVRTADALVFLKDGRVAAEGTFEHVQQTVPEFARLVELGKL